MSKKTRVTHTASIGVLALALFKLLLAIYKNPENFAAEGLIKGVDWLNAYCVVTIFGLVFSIACKHTGNKVCYWRRTIQKVHEVGETTTFSFTMGFENKVSLTGALA